MKQLDVDVSSPAFVWDPYFTMTLMTFDPIFNSSQDMIFGPVNFGIGLFKVF